MQSNGSERKELLSSNISLKVLFLSGVKFSSISQGRSVGAEPKWPSGIQHCPLHTDGHWFEPQPKPPPMIVDMSASM